MTGILEAACTERRSAPGTGCPVGGQAINTRKQEQSEEVRVGLNPQEILWLSQDDMRMLNCASICIHLEQAKKMREALGQGSKT
jgi:hypothetical protein